jgi:hypothetical protein
MTITYRTAGAWGAGKGSNLTPAEVDGNFWDHEGRIAELEDSAPEPNNISNILVTGTQMTIVLEDATEFGPFTLPQANFRPSVVDTIVAATDGTYAPVLGDANGYLRYSGSDPVTIPVPPNASVASATDTEISFYQAGTGTITIEDSTDVTINVPPGFLAQTAQQGALITLKKVATDEWDLVGWLAEDVTA